MLSLVLEAPGGGRNAGLVEGGGEGERRKGGQGWVGAHLFSRSCMPVTRRWA